MHLKPVLRALLVAMAGLALYAPCTHAADTSIARPFLYATPADIDALKKKLPTRPIMPKAGAIHLRIKPALLGATDPAGSVIFGDFDKKGALSIRYLKDADDKTATNIQARLVYADGNQAFNLGWTVPKDGELRLIVRYNEAGTVRIYVNGSPTAVECRGENKCDNTGWNPAAQNYYFVGRKDQRIGELRVVAQDGTETWNGSGIDWELGAAYYGLAHDLGPGLVTTVTGCDFASLPSDRNHLCNVAEAGRVAITDTAKKLALAHRLTGDGSYWTAAQHYVDVILQTRTHEKGLAVGGEWSQSARVAALGILYDWFYDLWSDEKKAEMRKAIVANIRADVPNSMMDLIGMNCGPKGKLTVPEPTESTVLACLGDPDIARYYIMGHNASAMAGTATGLLAIVDDDNNVRPLLDQIYGHLVDGMLPARQYISQDGGHHTLFAYGSTVGEVIERLIMWRRARAAHGLSSPELDQEWVPRLVFPFIDALRADGTYPASGDNFDTKVSVSNIGYMALAAATKGGFAVPGSSDEHASGIATAFYEDQVKGLRSRASAQGLWDALYFPEDKSPRVTLAPATRDLASHYSIAGNVFMRNTWDFANAALLDFKSTSFNSENHQHLDQNSFSLFYKAPLLVDSGYGDYGTLHWHNYYRRTIAHNTIVVYDHNEQYTHVADGKTVTNSNDGGQWYECATVEANGGESYPTLAEIEPGNINALDGVDEFEDKATYAYVSANAGKAYLSPSRCGLADKEKRYRLHPQDGFRRQIVYLRAKDQLTGKDKPPTILVYDRVHSPEKLTAVSLLHSAKRPATYLKPVQQLAPNASRYTVPGTKNAPLVVRNGAGMVTIEPLMPARAYITLAGGVPGDGSSCASALSTDPSNDCRFTVRKVGSDGKAVWTHYPIQTGSTKEPSDFGAWRIEIAGVPETSPTDLEYQYFLNVLRVADTDNGNDAPQENTAVLLPTVGSTHAVLLDPKDPQSATVLFPANFPDASEFRWQSGRDCAAMPFIAIGAVPNATYGARDEGGVCILALNGSGVALKSSEKGVIQTLPAL